MNKVLIGIIILLIGVCIYFGLQSKKIEYKKITRIDTLWLNDTIRDTVPIIKYVKVKEIVYDTLTTVDSILVEVIIPIEERKFANTIQYKDSSSIEYNAIISGPATPNHKPNLDSINFILKYPRITEYITVYPTKKWIDKFNIGVQAGFGYGFFNKKPDLYVGFGVGYEF